MAFIWAYMCSILRVHSNLFLSPTMPNFTDLLCSVHYEPSRQKWLPFENICAVYLEYRVLFNFVWPKPILLTLYIQYTKNPAVKSVFHLSLYVQYT